MIFTYTNYTELNAIKFIFKMNSNPILNPAYSLQKSNISLGYAEQPRMYATSQVNQYPAYSQHANVISSSYGNLPINASFNPAYTSANYLLPPN